MKSGLSRWSRPYSWVALAAGAAALFATAAHAQGAGDWTTYGKDLAGHRFADFQQITADSVKHLHVAWTLHLGGVEGGGIQGHGGLEGTPIAEGGMLYVTDGWGSVYKVDVKAGGKLVWKMDPKTDHDWAGAIACCGVNNRGVGLWKDLVISHTLDGRMIATDKATGTVKWQRQVADPDKGEGITAAPLVVKDLAITGVTGGEFGIRGWIAATDLNTGKELWRTYTIPAKGEPNSDSWKDNHGAINVGGGATWVTGTFDAKSNTIYWGVGNPGPDWDAAFRPGDNLYTDSVLALDADTGKLKWHFQMTPNDAFDYDGVNESVLIDADVKGKSRAMAVHADRNGFVYALDRNDGSFIWGSPFVKKLTWTKGLDPKTGKPVEYDPNLAVQLYNPAVTPSEKNPVTMICPTNNGGKNWPPTAYNPTQKLFYIPAIEGCNQIKRATAKAEDAKPRAFFTGGGPNSTEIVNGGVVAIDVTTGNVAARLDTHFPMLGGLLATPELVFFGDPSGILTAADAKTLKPLWTFNTGGGINAPPMSFMQDGKQYIALLVGLGGVWDKWNNDETPELKAIQTGSVLYVFALD